MSWDLRAGDALAGLKTLPSQSVDLVLADPPYGLAWTEIAFKTRGNMNTPIDWDHYETPMDYTAFSTAWIREAARILRPTGTLLVWGSIETLAYTKTWYEEEGLTHKGFVAWAKSNPMPSVRKRTYRSAMETVFWAVKGKGYTFNFDDQRHMRNVWEEAVPHAKIRRHRTQKPMGLTRHLIEVHTRPNDLIVVPFAGSGVEMVVAERLKRHVIGWELDPESYQKALHWLDTEHLQAQVTRAPLLQEDYVAPRGADEEGTHGRL